MDTRFLFKEVLVYVYMLFLHSTHCISNIFYNNLPEAAGFQGNYPISRLNDHPGKAQGAATIVCYSNPNLDGRYLTTADLHQNNDCTETPLKG
jgi:hypothetical protein